MGTNFVALDRVDEAEMSIQKAMHIVRKHNVDVRDKRSHPSTKPSLVGEYSNSLLILGYAGEETWHWQCQECKVFGKSKETRLRLAVCRCSCDPLLHKGSTTHGAFADKKAPDYRQRIKTRHAYSKMVKSGVPLMARWRGDRGFETFVSDMGITPIGHILYIHPLATKCSAKTVRWVDNSSQNYKKHKLTFNTWRAMIDRCASLDRYAHVTICDRWIYGEGNKLPFDCFLADMGPRKRASLTLDRVNGKKGYSPANCRWATATEQRLNQPSRTHRIKIKGEVLTVKELAARSGLSWTTVKQRLSDGVRASTLLKHRRTDEHRSSSSA